MWFQQVKVLDVTGSGLRGIKIDVNVLETSISYISQITAVVYVQVHDNDTRPVGCARNLGVWFNEKMSMSHIAKACSSVFFHLHNIRSPKKYLSVDSLQTIEHALITTQLDYYNRPKYVQISKLQHVQDATARLIIMSIIIMDIPNISSHTYASSL